jgi:hypothetical protein
LSAPMALPRAALLLLAVLGVSAAMAVNVLYDEMLWTKQAWAEGGKFPNPLLYSNPTDQEPKLLEVYPSIKGSVSNSIDGPNLLRELREDPYDSTGDE